MASFKSKSFINAFAIIIIGICVFGFEQSVRFMGERAGMEANIPKRIAWMHKTLADPLNGTIPEDIRLKELEFAKGIPVEKILNKTIGQWVQQGPYNIGGRTRAIALDLNNENTLIAGAAMGGIWRSTNNGNTWIKSVMDPEVFNVSCIAQDMRNGKRNIWYAGTGELYGGNIPGAYYAGNGMYKSLNGGISWAKVGTYSIPLGSIGNSWSAVHSVAVNPVIDTADVVFVANFDGIFRSLNGGLTWTRRRGGTISGYSYWTDIKISKTGVIYASLSSGGSHAGIWRSTDNGNNWTNITPSWFNNAATGRIIIALAPSDENQVYFLANTPGKGSRSLNFEGGEEWNSFWKYKYVSGDGSGAGGIWEDRSINLPKMGGAFGDFITQSGYCMGIGVKPDDANVIYLGGTNLYRSTDGFASATNTSWIGGYQPGTFLPDFKLYEQQHPDQHGVLFYPSNPKKMISVHDGGISLTLDNTASNIIWTSLNNGYLTTQFYTVAIDKENSNKIIIGGLQDNGTLFTNSTATTASWTLPLSYDGSYCYVASNASEYYMSIQQGRVMRMKLDSNGVLTQFARIDPRGIDKSRYQFINPYTPDANDWKVLYIPAGNIVWRNSDVTAIPLKTQADSTSYTINWQELSHTLLPIAGDEITSVLSSKLQKDVLFYGTAKGNLYRLKNASDTASVPVNIKGTNFPGGYINCIAQHPNDSNKLYIVFTNYSILSVFYTSNGGTSWTPISGNLEQDVSGIGNGPSCRWITLVPVQDSMIYYLGTSTGLYASKQINGMQTQWSWQAYGQIKNNIVMMMDHRTTDGLLAVATYGAGMFTAKITTTLENTGISKTEALNSIKIYPNPVAEKIKIEFADGEKQGDFAIYTLGGEKVLSGLYINNQAIDIAKLQQSIYIIQVQTENKKYFKKFVKL